MTTRERQIVSQLTKERGQLLRRMREAKRLIVNTKRSLVPWQFPRLSLLDAAESWLTLPRKKR